MVKPRLPVAPVTIAVLYLASIFFVGIGCIANLSRGQLRQVAPKTIQNFVLKLAIIRVAQGLQKLTCFLSVKTYSDCSFTGHHVVGVIACSHM